MEGMVPKLLPVIVVRTIESLNQLGARWCGFIIVCMSCGLPRWAVANIAWWWGLRAAEWPRCWGRLEAATRTVSLRTGLSGEQNCPRRWGS